MVSMDDVAVRARVSKATVSRVLSGRLPVSPKAKDKVLTACKELDYRLNANIQDLALKGRNGHTRNIAFVLAGKEFADPAYARWTDHISAAVNRRHYHLMLVKMTGHETSIYDLDPVLRDSRVDGVLLTGVINACSVEIMEKLGPPCVVLGNYSARQLKSLSSVQINFETLIFGAIEKLAKLGKKRVAFAEECPDNHASQEIFSSYKHALAEFGLSFDEKICYFGRGPFTGIFDSLRPVFQSGGPLPFDSVLCPDIRIAREISHLLFGHFGLRKQIDVTVAAMRPFSYHTIPVPAVYIDHDSEKEAETAMDLLVEQIEGKQTSRRITLS